jgi:hypothetical protein
MLAQLPQLEEEFRGQPVEICLGTGCSCVFSCREVV